MARKKSGDDGGGYNWMDTYGDMVTLLLTFFIMLFSMSSVNEEKWEVLVRAFARNPEANTQQLVPDIAGEGDQMAPAVGDQDLMVREEIDLEHERPISLSELYEFLKKYIEENNMEASVSIEKDEANNVYLRFDNNIFFDGDSAVLRRESYPILTFMGECLKSVEGQIFVVRVIGHTAAITENYPVNDWDLSSNRANRVATYFETQSGFEPKKLMTNGYGKNHPRFPNDTAEGRAKNRRVEIMILGNEFDTGNPEQLYSILQRMMDAEIVEDAANGTQVIGSEVRQDALNEESSQSEGVQAASEGAGNESLAEP